MPPRAHLPQMIRDAIERARHCVFQRFTHATYQGAPIPYVPLFMEEPPSRLEPAEMDICSVSFATSVLTRFPCRDPSLQAVAAEFVKFLLRVRSSDGSWPSLVYLEDTPAVVEMEGVLTETYWALRALLDAGAPGLPEDVAGIDLGKQLNVLRDALRWLDTNRVDRAWWYTGTLMVEDRDSLAPAVLPTAHAIQILDQTSAALVRFKDDLNQKNAGNDLRNLASVLLDSARTLKQDAVEWLRSFQNLDGGYGSQAGAKSSLTNTAVVLLALCTDDSPETARVAEGVLKHLLKRGIGGRRPVAEWELFEHFDQIRGLGTGETRRLRRRQIRHEKPLEPNVILAMVTAAERRWSHTGQSLYESLGPLWKWRFRRRLGSVVRALLKREVREGALAGAFRGHRQTPMDLPLYYSVDSIFALSALLPRTKLTSESLSRRQWIALAGSALLGAVVVVASLSLEKDVAISVICGMVMLAVGWLMTAIWHYATKA